MASVVSMRISEEIHYFFDQCQREDLDLPGFLQHCGNLAHLTIYPLGQTFPRLLSQFRGVGFSK